ncbi:MAG: hypothetical protein WCX48_08615 [Bacteroidales bacterium]
MPRRKEIKINPLELECVGDIIRELQADSRFENCDFSTLSLSVKEKKAPAKIMDVDKAINNLKNFMAVKGNSIEVLGGKQMIRKNDLAKMMKISRPTLDKWIKEGFISHGDTKTFLNLEIFNTEAVIKQLSKHL